MAMTSALSALSRPSRTTRRPMVKRSEPSNHGSATSCKYGPNGSTLEVAGSGVQGLLRHARRRQDRDRDRHQAAYRKLARQVHPDLNPGDKKAEARFKDINEANEVLGDPTSGASTTNSAPTGARTSRPQQGGRAPATGGVGPSTPGGGGYRTMTPEEMQALFGGRRTRSRTSFTVLRRRPARGPGRGRAGRAAAPTRAASDVEQPVGPDARGGVRRARRAAS